LTLFKGTFKEEATMIDFTPIREKEITWEAFAKQFSKQDLVKQTHEMTDKILELIAKCTDEDIVFQPADEDAHDPFAENPEDEDLAWNLGHVIVHITASSEEAAFMAAELARGVQIEPRRSRWEVPWEEVTSIEQCRRYLEQSRRMLLASLEMWPDEPHLENYYESQSGVKVTAVHRFLYGQSHADSHLGQVENIVKQAKG
jgi:hypothetical protein